MCDKKIEKYVWGEFSAAEQEEFEAQYFQDSALLDSLVAYCEDLQAAYVLKTMPVAQREKFAARLKALPFLQDQLALEQALHAQQKKATLPAPAAIHPEAKVPKNNWLTIFSGWGFLPPVAAAVGLLLLLGIGFWWRQKTTQPIAQVGQPVVSPSPAATLERLSPSASSEADKPSPTVLPKPSVSASAPERSALAMILLTPQITRSETQLPTLDLTAQSGQAQIELELPDDAAKSYQAYLQSADGKIIKSWSQLIPANTTLPIVRVRVAAALLTAREYEVVLLNTATQAQQRYPFQVIRK